MVDLTPEASEKRAECNTFHLQRLRPRSTARGAIAPLRPVGPHAICTEVAAGLTRNTMQRTLQAMQHSEICDV